MALKKHPEDSRTSSVLVSAPLGGEKEKPSESGLNCSAERAGSSMRKAYRMRKAPHIAAARAALSGAITQGCATQTTKELDLEHAKDVARHITATTNRDASVP